MSLRQTVHVRNRYEVAHDLPSEPEGFSDEDEDEPGTAPGFFFHGMSGNFSGTLSEGGLGWAKANSESVAGDVGGAMLPFHEAMRACNP